MKKNYNLYIIFLALILNLIIVVVYYAPKLNFLTGSNLKVLPLINAILNSFTFIFLLVALWFIKQKKIQLHKMFIFFAFGSTLGFLITYLLYHLNSTSTSYGGSGLLKYVYFFILITHIVLAIPTVLLALWSITYGLNMQIEKHRKIARITMPIWLYVSLTGVIVYIMISPYY